MFNSTILDVAIGMIFVYLLLSLMCSAASEIIELMLKKRAIDLERGIRELLAPGSKSGTPDVVQQLYNHPLVNSLFGGKYEETRIESTVKRKIMRTGLPSYIPARTFALALMDLVLPGVNSPPAAGGPAGPAGGPGVASGAAGATPPPADFEVKLTAPPPPPPPVATPANPLTPLRNAVGTSSLLTHHAQAALTALIDAAGSDVAKARDNIEGWFNNSMDRVSSWYKRRTQIVILIVGLFVAIALNADTIMMVRRLSTDKPLRDSLVAAAQEYAKTHASPEATASPEAKASPSASPAADKPKPSPNGKPAAASSPSPAATEGGSPSAPLPTPTPCPSQSPCPGASPSPSPSPALASIPECASDKSSDACRYAKLLLKLDECKEDKSSPKCKDEARIQMIPACVKSRTSPECKYEFNKRQIESLGLPIGWSSVDDPQRRWPGSNVFSEGGWKDQAYWHWLGWLLTALAISLGAPFWFDLLNKFIVIRSAVKPHEKSPEEESKG